MTRTPTPMRRGLLVAALLLPWMGRVGAASDAIVGIWLTDDAASKVEVGAAQASDGSTVYQGKVVWLKQPTREGGAFYRRTWDAALRSRPILGLVVLSGFKPAAGGWSGGTVYAPRTGKAYPADLAITPDGRLELKVKTGVLTKTDHWTR